MDCSRKEVNFNVAKYISLTYSSGIKRNRLSSSSLSSGILPSGICSHDSLLAGLLEDFPIPGQGEAGWNCGDVKSLVQCSELERPSKVMYDKDLSALSGRGHYREIVVFSCDRAGCPECYENWLSNKSSDISKNLVLSIEAFEGGNFPPGKVGHVIFSPPQEETIILLLNGKQRKLFSLVYKKAKRVGISGGYMIFHAWRMTGEGKRIWRKNTTEEKREEGYWKWILEEGLFKDWVKRGLIYFSPHFHIVAPYRWIKKTKESSKFNPEIDWVIKNKGKVRNIGGLANYLLSHAVIQPHSQAIRRFGVFTSYYLKKHEKKEHEDVFCEKCDSLVVQYRVLYSLNSMGEHHFELSPIPFKVVNTELWYDLKHPPPAPLLWGWFKIGRDWYAYKCLFEDTAEELLQFADAFVKENWS